MSRRGTSSGGGASSLGYLFGSDATPLARPNNRAPPRHPQAPGSADESMMNIMQQQYSGYNPPRSRQQQYEQGGDPPTSGYDTPTSGYETPTGYHTPSGYNIPSGAPHSADYVNAIPSQMPSPAMLQSNYRPFPLPHHNQTRAAGKVIHDGGGISLDMSSGSLGRNNYYFRADGQNSGNYIKDRPSTRVQAAPSGGSSLGYLFGGA